MTRSTRKIYIVAIVLLRTGDTGRVACVVIRSNGVAR